MTALLIDRPELAGLAQREAIFEHLEDPWLRPIADRIIQSALQGTPQPNEGELLELVPQETHRMLHEKIFSGAYAESEDPQAAFDDAIIACRRERAREQLADFDRRIAEARQRSDEEALRALVVERTQFIREQKEQENAQWRNR